MADCVNSVMMHITFWRYKNRTEQADTYEVLSFAEHAQLLAASESQKQNQPKQLIWLHYLDKKIKILL